MAGLRTAKVVGGGDLGREFRLEEVYRNFPNAELDYNPEKFAALIIRYQSPKATIILHTSRKYSLVGAKSLSSANEANDSCVTAIEELINGSIGVKTCEIKYVVCTADLNDVIDLNQATVLLGLKASEYEPEQFLGLFYRPLSENCFAIIFSSGKIVLNGPPDIQILKDAYQHIGTNPGI